MQEAADSQRMAIFFVARPTPLLSATNETLVLIGNDFARKRGWNDSAAEMLEKFKAERGLALRDDRQARFEYWEVDEWRKSQADAERGPGHGFGGVGDRAGAHQLCTDLADRGLGGGRMKRHEDDPSRDLNRFHRRWLGVGCLQK